MTRADWGTVAFIAAVPFLLAYALLNIALSPVIDLLAKPFDTPFWMHGRYKAFKDWDKTN